MPDYCGTPEFCDHPYCGCEPKTDGGSDMSSNERKFYPGQVVFDKKRTDPTDDLLVVVNPDIGTVDDLEGETKRLVKYNDTNTEIYDRGPSKGVPDDAPCITAAYIQGHDHDDPTLGSKEYTFPEKRMARVESPEEAPIDGYQPFQWALSYFFAEMADALQGGEFTIESVEDLQVLCMEASIDGKVISKGSRWEPKDTTAPKS